MYFPIADVTVSPILLMGVGFLVGILGGFFGVGGGFLAGPMMFWAGVPMNFVVGTDLAHMTGKSLVAARRHRVLGHVDFKLGLFMVGGTIVGVEIGAQIIELLQAAGNIDQVVGFVYIFILLAISACLLPGKASKPCKWCARIKLMSRMPLGSKDWPRKSRELTSPR